MNPVNFYGGLLLLGLSVSAVAFGLGNVGDTCTRGFSLPTCRDGLSCVRGDNLMGGPGLCVDPTAPPRTFGGLCALGTQHPCEDGSSCRKLPTMHPVLGGRGVCVRNVTGPESDLEEGYESEAFDAPAFD